MPTLVPIPKLGQSEETVKIEKWRVKEGDRVKKGDVLFEIETDKAVLEVESQFEGTVLKIVVPEGGEASVMSVAAVLGEPGEALPDIKFEAPKKTPTGPKSAETRKSPAAAAPLSATRPEGAGTRVLPVLPPGVSAAPSAEEAVQSISKPKPSPRARMFARDYLIDLDDVPGGRNGRVTEEDVRNYLRDSGYHNYRITPSAFNLAKKEKLRVFDLEGSGDGGRITLADVKRAVSEKPKELSTMRKTIARRLAESKRTIPHFYVTVSVDVTRLLELRKKLKEEGDILTVSDFIIKAAALSLRDFPMLNAETDGVTASYKSRINIGVAVSVESGLLVPVVRNADKKDVDEIHAEVAELAEAARTGKIGPEKLNGGTFTISNMGMLDVEDFAAIINPGQTAILAVASAMPCVVARDGKAVIRDMMKLTVSADHRLVDGAAAAKFANAVKRRLESPEELL